MAKNYMALPRVKVHVDAGCSQGILEAWRHSIGQAGVNSQPLPPRVITGAHKLKPRLVRIFLQEYFNIYPAHGIFNWSKLDPYMDSFAQTGAKLLATINIKPPVLYPQLNQDIWRPNDINEWQQVIYQLVRRYSVEKPIVTYWEHVNEPDIGETGGCPYRIPAVEELHEFYALTIQPILQAYPQAKVGGPAPADYRFAPRFIDLCARQKTQLDFVSYHRYDDDVLFFRSMAETLNEKLKSFPGKHPELMINEWNKGFDKEEADTLFDFVSVDEMAMQPRRAAHAASILLTMLDTPLDWSFYFLMWDNCMHPQEFASFFSPDGARDVMYKHWNEAPHRFGLFSENGKARPQYFVYQMLSRMGEERLAATSQHPDIRCLAARQEGQIAVMVVNFNQQCLQDRVVKLSFNHLKPGARQLRAYRIDDGLRWSDEILELIPYEERLVDVLPEFEYQCYSPADSVLMLTLEDIR
jgi:xylan 1,4-beta-xylosidase